MRVLVFVIALCLYNSALKSQNSQDLEVYNTYMRFLNECTHGLAIAKTLLDNNNKDLNRYIDLPSAKTIDINNDDLPSNYFDKPDDDSEFYVISPIELSKICKTESKALSSGVARSLNSQVDNIVRILNQINQIRFDLETYTEGHNLNEKESIYGVYEYLEKAVKLFNDYADAHKILANSIQNNYSKNTDPLYIACYDIHSTTKTILRNMRRESEGNVINNISNLTSDLEKFNSHVNTNRSDYTTNVALDAIKHITEKTTNTIQLVKDYNNPGFVPLDTELYGKHYYYHNQLLSRFFNYTGPGFVRDMNRLLSEKSVSHIIFDEEPLLFKVIYPIKVQESINLNTTKTIIEKPEVVIENKLEFSEVEKSKEAEVTPPPLPSNTEPEPQASPKPSYDQNLLILEIFDYSMLDKDSITVSFNGKIIIDSYQLALEAELFYLNLDPNGSNTLVITALNDGMMAPNTPSISYRRSGQRKKVKLKPSLIAQEVMSIDIE